MKLFHNEQEERLIRLIKQSKLNFVFNPSPTKTRLMQTLAEVEQNLAAAPKFFNMLVLRYSLITICLIFMASGGVVYASSASEPGDTLFGVHKLAENMILGITRDDSKKAEYHTKIVNDRLASLSKIEQQIQASELKVETRRLETVKESDISFFNAVETITTRHAALVAAGKIAAANQLKETLTKLESLADQYESKFQTIEMSTKDEKVKKSIQEHLTSIQKSKNKVQDRLNPNKD